MKLYINEVMPCCEKDACCKNLNDFFKKLKIDEPYININEVCSRSFKMNGYSGSLECCSTAKLLLKATEKNEISDLKTGERYEYLLTDKENNLFEITIDEINLKDNYLIIDKHHFDLSKLCLGEVCLNLILDYDKIPDTKKLEEFGFTTLPTFHESHIEDFCKEKSNMRMRFLGGFHPLITDLKITGIIKEEINMENGLNPIDYFSEDESVGRVQFQTTNNEYVVKISNNYVETRVVGWKPDMSYDEMQNAPRLSTKHKNEYFIHCKNIKMKFSKP